MREIKLSLYNTATKEIKEFNPQDSQGVRVYTCGPTVYSYLHIGNWAAYIYWDVLVRVLGSENNEVKRVMNITDVGHLVSDADEGEDKLEKGARLEGKTAWEIADFYIKDFVAGMEKFNLVYPDHLARATDYIEDQLQLIRTLKEKGFTYQIGDGIYFNTAKFPRYADFANLNLDELQAGARVAYNSEKRNPSDFALWKFSPSGKKRDMQWATPADLLEPASVTSSAAELVMGFPGWHLECSAIAMHFLGETLDIHTGGIDHIPVHHTNEIAQSEAATGQTFSKVWLHNNHMKVDGSKISKSLGNGYTLQDLEKRGFSALDLKLLVLQSHYQSESNFSFEALEAAKNRRLHWRNVAALRYQTPSNQDSQSSEQIKDYITKLALALDDNLNTPEALRIIDEVFTLVENAPLDLVSNIALLGLLYAIDNTLGLDLVKTTPNISESIKQRIAEREAARESQQWAESDSLRESILEEGILVRDTNKGSVWGYAA